MIMVKISYGGCVLEINEWVHEVTFTGSSKRVILMPLSRLFAWLDVKTDEEGV